MSETSRNVDAVLVDNLVIREVVRRAQEIDAAETGYSWEEQALASGSLAQRAAERVQGRRGARADLVESIARAFVALARLA